MTNALTIFNQLRPHTIGYDNIFDHFNDMFESSGLQNNYPPYDIIKQSDNKYDIQVALAGYSKDDIDVEVKDNTLSIKSVKKNEEDKETFGKFSDIFFDHYESDNQITFFVPNDEEQYTLDELTDILI